MKPVVVVALVWCAGAVLAQPQDNDARAILGQMGSAYRALISVELKGVQTREQHDEWTDTASRETFTLLADADWSFRAEIGTKMGTHVQVCDGSGYWNYYPERSTYTRGAGKAATPYLLDLQVDLRHPASRLKDAKILRQEVLDTGAGKHSCDVVEAHYERPQDSSKVDWGDTLLWVDRESHLLWKKSLSWVSDRGDRGKIANSETTVFSSIRTNVAIPEGSFVFTPPVGATEQTSSVNTGTHLLLGRPAPDFHLQDLDGKEVRLASFKGKVVLLDFWATWCGPCLEEMPKLNRLYKKFSDKNVTILGIDVLEDAETVRKFVQKNGYKYPILLATNKDSVIEDYGAHAYPSFVLIDKHGIVADYKSGSRPNSEQELAAAFVRVSGAEYAPPKIFVPPIVAPNLGDPVTRVKAPAAWPEPVTAEDFLHRGYKQLSDKHFDAAIQDANKALELQPGLLGALRCRAEALYNSRNNEAAIQEYSALIEKYPDWSSLYNRRGLAYSNSHKFDLAILDYTKAIELGRYSAGPYNNRGWSYLESGDLNRALEDFNRAIELAPEYVLAYENRANVFDKLNKGKSELADLDLILRLAPKNQWAKTQRDALLGLGEPGSAAPRKPDPAPAQGSDAVEPAIDR